MAEQVRPDPPRYRFVVGNGDEEHEKKVNEVNRHGYKAVLMTSHSGDQGPTIAVLMEREL